MTSFSVSNTAAPVAHRQSGVVMVTALLILLVFTLVAVMSMDSTQLGYQMSTNYAYSETSFNASESGRKAMADIIDEVIYERSWDAPRSLPAFANLKASGNFEFAAVETAAEIASPWKGMRNSSNIDLSLSVTEGSKKVLAADVAMVQGVKRKLAGSSLATHQGYEGLGKSVAKGGYAMYIEMRSLGDGPRNAASLTASEYRSIIAN